MPTKRKVEVVQDENNPVSVEILAESIKSISDGMKKILAGPLKQRALILLIQDAASRKVSRDDIFAVMASIENLAETYLKPKKKK